MSHQPPVMTTGTLMLAARVPGVLSVESDVRWEIDDTTRKGRRALEQSVR